MALGGEILDREATEAEGEPHGIAPHAVIVGATVGNRGSHASRRLERCSLVAPSVKYASKSAHTKRVIGVQIRGVESISDDWRLL